MFKKCENPACENIVTEYVRRSKKLKQYCSAKCRGKHNAIKSVEKRKQTCLDRYNNEHAVASAKVKEKIKRTMIENHGVEWPMQSTSIREKAKKTILDRHGVENPFQLEEVKNKIKETNLRKLGVMYPMQSEVVRDKSKATNLEKYSVEYPSQCESVKNKIKGTTIRNYGVEYPLQSNAIMEKMKKSMLERHGASYSLLSLSIIEKINNTMMARYGVKNASNSVEINEKRKQKCLEKYMVEYPAQLESVKNKIKETNMMRHGSVCYANKHIPENIKLKINDSDWLKNQNNEKTITQIATECNVSDFTIFSRLKKYNIPAKRHAKSFFEKQIFAYVESVYPNIIQNDRTQIKPYELDVYLPNLNLAFECNGEYWHKDPQKEINKFDMCAAIGIDLHFIWYKDWKKDQEKIKKYITNIIEQKSPN